MLKKGYSKGILKRGTQQSGAQRSNGLCGMAAYRVLTARTHNGCPVRRLRRAYCRASLVSTRACAPALRVGCDRKVLPGYSHGTHGYSHGAALPRQARGTPSWSCRSRCGTQRAVHGSPGHPSVGFVRHGTVEYSQELRRSHGYSRVLTCTHTVPRTPPFWLWANVTQYMAVCGTTACSGTARVEQHRGTHTVLKGTPTTALPRRVHETPSCSCCSICGTHRAVHGSPGHMRVWFVW